MTGHIVREIELDELILLVEKQTQENSIKLQEVNNVLDLINNQPEEDNQKERRIIQDRDLGYKNIWEPPKEEVDRYISPEEKLKELNDVLKYLGINPEKEVEKKERLKINKQRKRVRLWQKNNPDKMRVYKLMLKHPENYPTSNHCFYCNETDKLERGHLDYDNNGHNYVTTCRSCNLLMTKNPEKLIRLFLDRKGRLNE